MYCKLYIISVYQTLKLLFFSDEQIKVYDIIVVNLKSKIRRSFEVLGLYIYDIIIKIE